MNVRAVLVIILALSTGACGGSDAESDAESEAGNLPAQAPWGLQTVELPDDSDAMADVFAAMPDEIDGVPREATTAEGVTFVASGERHLQLSVMELGGGLPAATVAEFLSGMVESGEMEIVESQLDETSQLVWLAGTTIGDGVRLHVASWGLPDGDRVFSAFGDSDEARTELIREFVDAVRSTG